MTTGERLSVAGITGDTCLLVPHALYPSERRAWRDGDLGSPMFISVELLSPDQEATSVVTRPVLKRLQAIDNPEHADERNRALPEDAGAAFMDAFAEVVDREVERNANSFDAEPVRTNPLSLHRPRHDIESFWWVAFWALIRASPLPRSEEEDTGSHAALCTVSDSMLDLECLGSDMARARYLVDPPVKALHPVLRRYGSLLKDLVMYIAMPWHLYDATLPPTHAHSAFLRMLLSEICISGGDNGSHILLDTAKPRSAIHTHWLEVYARDLSLSVGDALPGSPPDAAESPSRQYTTAGIVAAIPSKRTLIDCDSDALEQPRKRLRDELWDRPEQDEQGELEATTRNDD